MNNSGVRIEIPVHIKRDRRARRLLVKGEAPAITEAVPRIARLLALAHKWEGMARRGKFKDLAEFSRVCGLWRGLFTHHCNLVLLAPDLQEANLDPALGDRTGVW